MEFNTKRYIGKQPLLNTYVNNLNMVEAIRVIEDLISRKHKSYIVAVNVDVIVKIENDSKLKEIVDNADIVLVDGKPLIWISEFYKKPVKEKVSGSDLVPELCKVAACKGYTMFILGGKDGVAERAKQKLLGWFPEIKIVGTYAPPLGFEKNEKELIKINDMISKSKPDILIACLGCPKQEKWIYDNYKKYNATVSICAGATVDFLAGDIDRAPRWMREYGLEWFFRFLQEPNRLFKRYFLDDMKILKLLWKYRK